MNPRTLLRTAALNALVAAAQQSPADPDFAPLATAQVFLGQTWPSQSPSPGQAAMPNQLLIYGWDEDSESTSGNATAAQFTTTLGLTVEARCETKFPAAAGTLNAPPNQSAIDAAIDGALDALAFAVKKAICQNIQGTALALNAGPVIESIKAVKSVNKYDGTGQRVLGNGAVLFDLTYTETFNPYFPNALTEISSLILAQASAAPNMGNHGNGTIGTVSVGLGVQLGDYALIFTSATAFTLTFPDTTPAGTGTVGQPVAAGGLAFEIAAGTTPFAPADGFTIIVTAAAQLTLDPSA